MNVQQAVVEHRWVKPIDQLGLADAPSVGGKAANLGELTRARYPVPPGFAVTAEGYLEAMEKAGVRDTLRDHALPPAGADDSVLTAASQQLRATVLGVLMPAALRAEILGSYREFGAGSPRLAVRSSAPPKTPRIRRSRVSTTASSGYPVTTRSSRRSPNAGRRCGPSVHSPIAVCRG